MGPKMQVTYNWNRKSLRLWQEREKCLLFRYDLLLHTCCVHYTDKIIGKQLVVTSEDCGICNIRKQTLPAAVSYTPSRTPVSERW